MNDQEIDIIYKQLKAGKILTIFIISKRQVHKLLTQSIISNYYFNFNSISYSVFSIRLFSGFFLDFIAIYSQFTRYYNAIKRVSTLPIFSWNRIFGWSAEILSYYSDELKHWIAHFRNHRFSYWNVYINKRIPRFRAV